MYGRAAYDGPRGTIHEVAGFVKLKPKQSSLLPRPVPCSIPLLR